jgi:hypothetical protein
MSDIETQGTDIPQDVRADAQLIAECIAFGKPIPPEVAHRVQEDAQQITERLRRQYGLLDVGVPAVRELRGKLPES